MITYFKVALMLVAGAALGAVIGDIVYNLSIVLGASALMAFVADVGVGVVIGTFVGWAMVYL